MTIKPTKICMLSDSHGLYDDRIYWKEAISLKKHGHDVYYVLAGDKDVNGTTNEGINYTILKKDTFKNNRLLNYLAKSFLPNGFYLRMFSAAKKINADVYHIHDLKVNKIGKRLKSLQHNPKVIYDVHEPYPENIRDYFSSKGVFTILKNQYSKYIQKWEKERAKNYDFIITTEENMQARFRDFMPDKKVGIIFNYTNLESTRKNLEFEEKIYDGIYTGGITRRRGAFKILKAVKIAVEEKPDLQILFLGLYFPSEFKSEMQEFVNKNNLQENVILHDSVPYIQVADFYNTSKIGFGIFLPNETHRIILQIKIFEYMNYGLPIVGSNFGHINNYIVNDEVGLTVDPESPEEISDAVLKILNDRELYVKFSKNGIAAVENKYRWEFMEKKLISIYSNLLKKD